MEKQILYLREWQTDFRYAHNLGQDAITLEELWRKDQLDDVVEVEKGKKNWP